ncbi:hypothetical protein TrVE_jg14206 [Triparma verrucosa]|uniref:Uncharacterized protein n=1 Tax=Triparma verrucosa TaxID=1606542 RepID=A0A9W7ENJ4_9STRA|nr:hypothetical protein TrVE_jg14206 [Triparma verrucosa]
MPMAMPINNGGIQMQQMGVNPQMMNPQMMNPQMMQQMGQPQQQPQYGQMPVAVPQVQAEESERPIVVKRGARGGTCFFVAAGFFLLMGFFLQVLGRNAATAAANMDPDNDFVQIKCQVKYVLWETETRTSRVCREKKSSCNSNNGGDCCKRYENVEMCYDKYSTWFIKGISETMVGQRITSESQISQDENDDELYTAFPVEVSRGECDGLDTSGDPHGELESEYEPAQILDCWKVNDGDDDDDDYDDRSSTEFEDMGYTCPNDQCLKLRDPAVDKENAATTAKILNFAGYALFLPTVVLFLCGRREQARLS